jgi:predicted nucleic acid-binding protein
VFDLSTYSLGIDRAYEGVQDWFRPVLDRGRGAAFVDTGFLKAIINDKDPLAPPAKRHYEESVAGTNFYTTSLVLAEAVRQVAKQKGIDFPTQQRQFERCSELLIDRAHVFVCHPPREVLMSAYEALRETRQTEPTLDLSDALSIAVLDYARHRRVFGFDGHFRTFGAQLEPIA